ncbi:RNA polymerase sigma factor [Lederbergia ruris]|uniref:RNA polymerase sigma factor n=1 Tax=Lederbergia ruris TaxID=217495 RepID=A0ABQ4KH86_9BACI|nr:RNA polymerase sigma factor [Lederbergia ruris]GIN56484.1 RNA polymerase sigma factor [Lederbergia ruris]
MEDNQESIHLLQSISQGSRHAFDLFYEEYVQFVYNIAFQYTKDHGETEDLCHDIFLEVLQKADQYNPAKGSVRAWLAVKTKSRSLDRLRKKKALLTNRLEELLIGEEKSADVEFLAQLEQSIIFEALKSIPNEQREAIIRSYFQGETHKEIASTMNKPLGSIKSLIRYGLNNMRKQKSLLNWVQSGGGEKNNGM